MNTCTGDVLFTAYYLVTIVGYESSSMDDFCIRMQMSMNVTLGVMDATTNVTTHWAVSTVRVTLPLIWILMEGPASLVYYCYNNTV